MDLEKIEAIMDWPTLNNVTSVRYFMGLAGYYRRFIEGFSNISHPITSLQRKNAKFVWYAKCEESFQKLKKLLSNAHVLNIANQEKDCVVCTDACSQGLEGFLMQENDVIC